MTLVVVPGAPIVVIIRFEGTGKEVDPNAFEAPVDPPGVVGAG